MIEKKQRQRLEGGPEQRDRREKGRNVEIVLHVMRHGDRGLEGELQDHGRERTENIAQSSPLRDENFNIVKAIGSDAGPAAIVDEQKMARSLETAHIFSKNIANNRNYKTRPVKILSYGSLVSKLPYNHRETYDSLIGEYIENNFEEDANINRFEDLNSEQKKAAANYADNRAVAYFMALDTPEARQFKKEIAGSFAYLISHYAEMAQEKLYSNQKILYPTGSHTGMMEPFLAEAMTREDGKGEKIIGGTLQEIGGNFDPSEGFNIRIKTDQEGELEPYTINFESDHRPSGVVYLDADKIKELDEFYRTLHKNKEVEE